jgi:hypothetical protein
MVVDLQQAVKKGVLLVTADVAGADVYVDGTRRDSAPALIADLPEGQHSIEVRKDPLQAWKQIVNVVGNQQLKIEAKLQPAGPATGSLRIVSSTPGAEVFVDGEDKGAANTEITGVRVGQHIAELRAKSFTPQSVEVTIAQGEQRIARLDLVPTAAATTGARLRVVTPVPDAEVFVDGASVGRSPFDRNDLSPGKHYVIVRKPGYAEWKREVDLDPTTPTTLTVELSASGTVKILSNVSGATVIVDGAIVGKTPATVENLAAGEHLVEVKQPGYVDARQGFHLEGGEQKILAADLAPIRKGPTAQDIVRRRRGMTSFSGVTVDPARFTADIATGFVPFAQVRLTVGAFRYNNWLGMDAGIELRTIGYFTEGGAHAKLQFVQAGPVAIAFDTFIGGGGGPTHRNDFVFEAGVPFTLLFGDLVRFTAHPYLQIYSDKNCPTYDDIKTDASSGGMTPAAFLSANSNYEEKVCESRDGMMGNNGASLPSNPMAVGSAIFNQDPRARFVGARLMLQAVLEIAVHDAVNLFFLFEGDPVGQRAVLTQAFSPAFRWTADPQVYGRIGLTFKF